MGTPRTPPRSARLRALSFFPVTERHSALVRGGFFHFPDAGALFFVELAAPDVRRDVGVTHAQFALVRLP